MWRIFISILFLLVCSQLEAKTSKLSSRYTDLSGSACKTIAESKSDDEGAWAEIGCPGILGYKLNVSDDDNRQSVIVVDPKGKKHSLKFYETVTGAFASVGNKAEWRVRKVKGKETPIALIVRLNASILVEEPEKKMSYLVIAKITPQAICVVGKIPPRSKQNEFARLMADQAAKKPCLR